MKTAILMTLYGAFLVWKPGWAVVLAVLWACLALAIPQMWCWLGWHAWSVDSVVLRCTRCRHTELR